MKKILTLLLAVVAINVSAQTVGLSGALGKPDSDDTVSGAGQYALTIAPGTSLAKYAQMGTEFKVLKTDSVKNCYVKLQAKIGGDFHDVGTDSTFIALTNETKTYALMKPTTLSPYAFFDTWRLLLVVPGPSKFVITGRWKAL